MQHNPRVPFGIIIKDIKDMTNIMSESFSYTLNEIKGHN